VQKISIVIPVFNNEESLEILVSEILHVVSEIEPAVALEILFIEDGSTDKSWTCIFELAKKYPTSIRAVKLSRNFGQLAAMVAGWELSRGDAVINMSADLQDPPSLIPLLVRRWRDGFDVVVGVRSDRKDGILARLTSNIAHRVLRGSNPRFPKTWFDYTITSRRNLEVMNGMSGRFRFTQGDLFYAGFNYASVPYTREKRRFGKSGYNFWKRFNNFTDAALDSSYNLIRFFIRIGVIFSVSAVLYAVWIVIAKVLGLIQETGWAPLMVILLLCSGLIMLMLGIIAEYLWRIYDSTRSKPTYVVETEISSALS
jgi:glycosyltransferase involved in cell wall biosynthesis